MNILVWFIVLFVMLPLVIVLLYTVQKTNQGRQQARAEIAEELGLSFHTKGDNHLAIWLNQLPSFLLKQPLVNSQSFHNVMTGKIEQGDHEVTVTIFDYHYKLGQKSSANSTTHILTILLFSDSLLHLPNYCLYPENVWHKLGNAFKSRKNQHGASGSLDLLSGYRLEGISEAQARSLFQPNLLRLYEQHKIHTQVSGSTVAILPEYYQMLKSSEIKTFFNVGLKLISILEQNSR